MVVKTTVCVNDPLGRGLARGSREDELCVSDLGAGARAGMVVKMTLCVNDPYAGPDVGMVVKTSTV
jgi:hypothetical protein